MKAITLYFTRSGHTKAVAGTIRETVGGDMKEIRTKRTYSGSYGIAVLQGGLEKFRHALPDLEEIPDLSGYDVIFLGTPVWWFTISSPMKSFIAKADLKGKKVCPFITSGGQPSSAPADFTKLLSEKGAVAGEGLHADYTRNILHTPASEIKLWAEKSL